MTDLQAITPEYPFEEGAVLPIDKPLGWTSTDVVRKLRTLLRRVGYRKIKVGHAGTLDPLANGVLLVCVGRATKRVDELQAEQKEYLATVQLGATTPSYDLEHPIDQHYPWEHITTEQVCEALRSFEGEQQQEPPVYSAKKLAGKRAYEYARQGQEVEMRSVPVTFYEVELIESRLPAEPLVVVRVTCSKGTYIRSFARDLGLKLSSGGHLAGLRRTRSGGYKAENCLTMEEIQQKLSPGETKIG